MSKEMNEYFGEVIYSYTRAQAIEDGVLADVTETAREAGIKFPVAVTEALWTGYIEPDEGLKSLGQSVDGRLWDVLWMFRCAASKFEGDTLFFDVIFTMPHGKETRQQTIKLKAICGPGDSMEPVITIMLPNED